MSRNSDRRHLQAAPRMRAGTRTPRERVVNRRAQSAPSITVTLSAPSLLQDWRLVLGLILAFGLLVRLWAMHWPPFPTDMNDWIAWGERIRSLGPRHFYAPGVFADYAPGYIYVLWLTATIKHALFSGGGNDIYYFLYRLPPLLCDLGTAALIYLTLDRARRMRLVRAGAVGQPGMSFLPAVAALIYVLNPALIFNSAVWGQIDSTFTFFLLLSVLLLLRDRPEAAVVSYVIAFMIKPQAIALAPVIGLALIMRTSIERLLRAAAIGVLLAFVLSFPFFGISAFSSLVSTLRKSTEAYAYTSLFTYNLWGVYGFWKPDTVSLAGGLTLQSLGYLLYGAGLVYGVMELVQQLRRKTDSVFTIFLFCVYFAFLPIIVLTRMHERYIYPIFPFLLIFAFLSLDRMRAREDRDFAPRFLVLPLLLYGALTLLHTMNIYQVYEYYLYYNKGGVPQANGLFYAIYNNAKVWSVWILLAFTTFVLCIPYWLPPWSARQPNRDPRRDEAPAERAAPSASV